MGAFVGKQLVYVHNESVGMPPSARFAEMNNAARLIHYQANSGFPSALSIGDDGRLFGIWIMGNDYRVRSGYYGGYPATYLRRVRALFPDKASVLHLFSGSVDTTDMAGDTVDTKAELHPTYVDNAERLADVPLERYDLVLADPPYSAEDAEHYGCAMVNRNKVMSVLGARLTSGCHVAWLDQVLPMFRKTEFAIDGVIGIVKSTNHRFRVLTIFRKIG